MSSFSEIESTIYPWKKKIFRKIISLKIGPNYPLESSPDLHDNAEEYEKSQFLRSVRQALESRVKKLPARHTLTQLLTAWEMGVRSACSFKKRPGSPTIPLVTNFSEIATVWGVCMVINFVNT